MSYYKSSPVLILKQKYSFDEIIVVSPGTSNFRIGIASNKSPVSVPSLVSVRLKPQYNAEEKHLIDKSQNRSQRGKSQSKKNPFDFFDPKEINTVANGKDEKSHRRKVVEKVLREEINGKYLHSVTKEQVKNEEKYSEGEAFEITMKEGLSIPPRNCHDQFYFGQKANELRENKDYETFSIFKNGVLNFDEVSEAILKQVVTSYLTSIFSEKMTLGKDRFKDFCIAFVVPLSFCKTELTFFADIFLNNLKFKSIFFHQEAALSCFGNGFSGACVVDIGHESSKVCCVQYGSVVLPSKIILPFGGKDITELSLYATLSHSANEFRSPIRPHLGLFSRASLFDFFEWVKRDKCAFPGETRPVKSFARDIKLLDGRSAAVRATLSAASVLPPLGLFYPQLFARAATRKRKFWVHEVDRVRFEYEKPLLMDMKSESGLAMYQKKKSSTNNKFKAVSLSQAIVESILSLPKAEDRMSMATSILLVGGSSKIPGMAEFIEQSVKKLLREKKSNISHVEILPRREEKESGLPPEYCSWLGMSIVCGNESCKEMWIVSDKWKRQRNLLHMRKKLPFELEIEVSNQI